MQEYIFVCIGTNRILSDSFGPRVGEKLEYNFREYSNIKVYGTMRLPVHLKNAPILSDYLNKFNNKQIILIDSAIGEKELIGESFVNLGGIKIGNAYGSGFYFPASLNIKTVIGTKNYLPNWNVKQIDDLAEKVVKSVIHYQF